MNNLSDDNKSIEPFSFCYDSRINKVSNKNKVESRQAASRPRVDELDDQRVKPCMRDHIYFREDTAVHQSTTSGHLAATLQSQNMDFIKLLDTHTSWNYCIARICSILGFRVIFKHCKLWHCWMQYMPAIETYHSTAVCLWFIKIVVLTSFTHTAARSLNKPFSVLCQGSCRYRTCLYGIHTREWESERSLTSHFDQH